MTDNTLPQTPGFKPKKSVALSGVPAGNTALCTVGRSGNDLSYRGYDILDLAKHCEFEEVAHLLIHGHLPNRFELAAYKQKLKSLRGLPIRVIEVLESLPAHTHPMDVMRTGCSMLGNLETEEDFSEQDDKIDRMLAVFPSIITYWYRFAHEGVRIETESDVDSIGGHFLELLHGKKPSELHERVMNVSLILYAEHEFNASTFTARVCAS
ncbi:citrate/2-methylcitrate synthase, partial [Moraxella sp.]|uniref:citrate/2-methylcitrate synthase n=1 Tax=Moraxella sp. TaxID=479 RepID=UPI00260CD8DC